MKNILITGGTGFIGSELVKKLHSSGHTLHVMSRQKQPPCTSMKRINVVKSFEHIPQSTQLDAVINLAGEPIADKRWSKTRKQQLEQSRIGLTESLIQFLRNCEQKPSVLISGSAVGFYGACEDKPLSEESKPTDDYPHQLCAAWEKMALSANELGIRTSIVRTGLVVGKNGGFLQKMLPAFKWGMGGPLASGTQWMSWIHLQDMVNIIEFLLINDNCEGIFNATAPNPVTNRDFTLALNQQFGKSMFLSTPAWFLKLMFGEMSTLLIDGQRVIPKHLLDQGFSFRYTQLSDALQDVVNPKSSN